MSFLTSLGFPQSHVPGLPTGWTSAVEGAVDKPSLLDRLSAWDLPDRAVLHSVGMRKWTSDYLVLLSCSSCWQDDQKIHCVSLFAGIAGLELGVHPSGPWCGLVILLHLQAEA